MARAASSHHVNQKKKRLGDKRQGVVVVSFVPSHGTTTSSRALGKLKKEKMTVPSSVGGKSCNAIENRSDSVAGTGANRTRVAGQQPMDAASGRKKEICKSKNDIVKEYMQQQFLSKFRPQRAQYLRLRCSGIRERQQQQLVIPTRQLPAAEEGEYVRGKWRKIKKRTLHSQRNAKTNNASETLRKVCSEALLELGI